MSQCTGARGNHFVLQMLYIHIHNFTIIKNYLLTNLLIKIDMVKSNADFQNYLKSSIYLILYK